MGHASNSLGGQSPRLLVAGFATAGILVLAGIGEAGPTHPARADAPPVQVGQIGGAMFGVAQAGDIAFVGQGSRVVSFDLSRPAMPRLLGRGPILDDLVIDLALVHGHIVALLRHEGLVVLDRSRPEDLEVVGRSGPLPDGHFAYALAVVGGLALVGTSEGLLVTDLTDLRRPSLRGVLELSACGEVVVHRGRAICAESGALQVIDVSQPDQPRLTETVPMDGGVHSLTATDAYLYVGLGRTVAAVDLEREPDARIVHRETLPFETWRLQAQGERLIGGQGRWLVVLDLSAPDIPRLLGTLMEGDWSGAVQPYLGLSSGGDLALLVSPYSALQVIDVSDPRAPTRVGGFVGLTTVNKVTMASGTHAVVESSDLQVWDVSDPAAARLLGITPPGERRSDVGRVDVEGTLACAPTGGDFVQLFDIADPTAPHLVANVEGTGLIGHCLLHGDLALVAGNRALVVVDIAEPSAPRILGRIEADPFLGNGLDAVGTTAFVATSFGLLVVDLADPTRPREVAELDLPDVAMAVVVRGTHAYVLQRERGLVVVDITDASQPRVVGELALPGNWSDSLAVDGNLAVTASPGRLFVLDLSAPASPRLLHTLRRPSAQRADLRNGLVASAEHDAGLAFLRVEPGLPTTPSPSATSPGPPATATPTGPEPAPGRSYLPWLSSRR